jgi:NAD(P)H dehydrogenase (quinone)
MSQVPILVSGASGQVGQRVIEFLLGQETGPIIATTRTPENHKTVSNRNLHLRPADFDDRRSLPEAFKGAKRLLLISTNSVDVPGRRIIQHRNAIEAANEAGVEHIVYTSFLEPLGPGLSFLTADHVATESLIKESGLGYTVLRNSFYPDMLTRMLAGVGSDDCVSAASGNGQVAYVTREDCARAAGAALLDTFCGKRVLDITGPTLIGAEDVAKIASGVLGKEIATIYVSGEELQSRMISSGIPARLAALLAQMECCVARGVMEIQSDDIRSLVGHPATSPAEFISSHLRSLCAKAAQPS